MEREALSCFRCEESGDSWLFGSPETRDIQHVPMGQRNEFRWELRSVNYLLPCNLSQGLVVLDVSSEQCWRLWMHPCRVETIVSPTCFYRIQALAVPGCDNSDLKLSMCWKFYSDDTPVRYSRKLELKEKQEWWLQWDFSWSHCSCFCRLRNFSSVLFLKYLYIVAVSSHCWFGEKCSFINELEWFASLSSSCCQCILSEIRPNSMV